MTDEVVRGVDWSTRRVLAEFCRHNAVIGAHILEDDIEDRARAFFGDAPDVREIDFGGLVWCAACTADMWDPFKGDE